MASRPDTAAQTALGEVTIRPAFLCWLDIVGDPVYATTFPTDLSPTGTGDPDLDGKTFSATNPDLVDVGEIQLAEGGTETLTVSLSGLIGPNNDLLNIIGDRANWQGREARFWQGVQLPGGTIKFWNLITARMSNVHIAFGETSQMIIVSLESYLAAIAEASNRTYLDQQEFDPDDHSAAATIACANGIGGSNVAVITPGGYGGGGIYNQDIRYV